MECRNYVDGTLGISIGSVNKAIIPTNVLRKLRNKTKIIRLVITLLILKNVAHIFRQVDFIILNLKIKLHLHPTHAPPQFDFLRVQLLSVNFSLKILSGNFQK